MSERDGKTEQPTARKRSQARERGQVARSPEIAVAASLLGAVAVMRVLGPSVMETLQGQFARLFSNLPDDTVAIGQIAAAFGRIGFGVAGPFLVLAVVVGVGANAAQVGLSIRPKAFKPSFKKLSPKQGLQRFKPTTMGWELTRTAAKLGLLAAVVVGPLLQWRGRLGGTWSFSYALAETGALVWTILVRVVLLAIVVAVADYVWKRRETTNKLKMSKQEVKDERKQMEGDPQLKAQRRQRARELSRNRMLTEVTHADVVITNPTHVAVALTYRDGMAAPTVVAKGTDHLAATIRSIAYRHGVQVISDPPLARALFRRVKLGGFVPVELFEAVALVLATAYRRYGRIPA